MRAMIALLCLVCLAGCASTKPAASPSPGANSQKIKPAVKPKTKVTKASADDLSGHAFVNVSDHSQGLVFTASTSGYFMDRQASQAGADFATTQAGIFEATLTVSGMTYTIQGTAQANAASNQVQFKKISNTLIQQLPNGPRYKRVKHDDLNAVSAP
ncbi:hypothetical protein [Lacticaseibacillus jixiensis]|uniref:hypothetical protein n=1 Tax=Lacticaseibacillus jixiensis TaxID=3231926 RepID=UPI0036F39252